MHEKICALVELTERAGSGGTEKTEPSLRLVTRALQRQISALKTFGTKN